MRIIAATQNAHKIIEINEITRDYGMNLVSQKDAGYGDIDIDETGTTFEENSFLKADGICRISGEPAIADDSGLCVEALGGAPGIYSARFGGEHGNDALNRRVLLEKLKDVPPEKRTAKFVCVITLVYPDGEKLVARGECPGRITTEELGDKGFGYDSLFIPDGHELTFAQMEPELKNDIGHRARALKKLRAMLEDRK